MNNIDVAGGFRRSEPEHVTASTGDLGTFTPAVFFKDAGTFIAVCLALGLLMQVLLG